DHTWSLGKEGSHFAEIKILVKFHVDCLRVTTDCRYTYRCRCYSDGIVAEYFSRFIHHLHFFLRVTIIEEGVNMRKRIHVDRMRIDFRTINPRTLIHHLLNCVLTCTSYRLIRGYNDAFDAVLHMQWRESQHHLNGRTI